MRDKKSFAVYLIRNTAVFMTGVILAYLGLDWIGATMDIPTLRTGSLTGALPTIAGYGLMFGFIYTYQFQRDRIDIKANDSERQLLLKRVLAKYRYKLEADGGKTKSVYKSNLLNHIMMGRVTVEHIGDSLRISGPICVTMPIRVVLEKQRMKGRP